MLDYFLPGPAHPPKSDNVAKRPPAMLETDQDFPITIKATSEGGRKRPAAALYIMYIELLPGLRLNQMAHRSQWSHSTVRSPCVL